MGNRNKNKIKKNKDKPYCGPFQSNNNLKFDQVRKNMITPIEGPTANTMSYSDSTIDTFDQNNSQNNIPKKRPKRKRQRVKTWFEGNVKTIVSSIIIPLVVAGGGVLIYNYSNHFVANDKDIEYLKNNDSKQDIRIEKLNEQTISLDKKGSLMQQQIELKTNNRSSFE